MNGQALNKKLNAWAGTEGIDYTDPEFGIAYCFKGLVPKLKEQGFLITLRLLGSIQGDWEAELGKGFFPYKMETAGYAETPALALCRAIERLIEKRRGRIDTDEHRQSHQNPDYPQ